LLYIFVKWIIFKSHSKHLPASPISHLSVWFSLILISLFIIFWISFLSPLKIKLIIIKKEINNIKLIIDLSNFDTRSLGLFDFILGECNNLHRIDISNFNVDYNKIIISGLISDKGVVIVNEYSENTIKEQVPNNWIVLVKK